MPKDKPDKDLEDNNNVGDEKPELLTHPSYEELMQKLDEAELKANQNWERVLRMQAENENVLRRAERDVASAHKYGLEKFATELLPIVDSLELCITSVPGVIQEPAKSVVEGVKLTLKMFYTALEKFGIQQVNPEGEPFDPEFQQAISVKNDPSVKPGTVVQVLQKGYTLNNRLLRPALVIVSAEEK